MKLSILIVILATLLAVVPAFAGWTVTRLNPGGASSSSASGISGGVQVGSTKIADYSHASMWSGTADSWVDLSPVRTTNSYASDVSGSQQVGWAQIGSTSHASLWNGSANNWVDLHPAEASMSEAYGVDNGKQVGGAKIGIFWHAGIWSGSTASWIDLNPTGYISSMAVGISSNQQVGTANYVDGNYNEYSHAGIWSGTAESWADINPTGAKYSYAYGISGNQQVGTAYFGSDMHAPLWSYHASLWSGTSGSWIDLNPTGSEYSQANGIFGGLQVGTSRVVTYYGSGVNPDVNNHASLWRGTAASWEDLHLLLPTGAYSSSTANDIYVFGTTIQIVGTATNAHGWDSILWQYTSDTPVPEPAGVLAVGTGLIGFLGIRRKKTWR